MANSVYQQVLDYSKKTSGSPALMQVQAQLNQLTLVENLSDWRETITKNMKDGSANRICDEWNRKTKKKNTPRLFKIFDFQSIDMILNEIVNQLAIQDRGILLQQIDNLQHQIEQLPKSHAALFIRLNFAKSLIRLNRSSKIEEFIIEEFLKETIKQARDIGDLKVESYAYGYLGELHEKPNEWELAKDNTQKALFIAQSLATAASPSEIEYLWEWQLGRIYKSQLPPRAQAQTKEIQQESPKNLDDARQMYQQAYLTLQSLRRELVAGNPDAELSFQNDIEDIYRDYVNLLLWDSNPHQENLSKAREVISSLQAVELENFLRLACPESNIEEIDKIIDEQPVKTAFFYPILVEDRIEVEEKIEVKDRIEVIIKLPDDPNLKHYSTQVDEATVKEQIRELQIDVKEYTFNGVLKKLQLDFEEEYTFEDVKKEGKLVYDWLLKGAEQYLKEKEIVTLVFALDTNLRNIPLAALLVNDKEKIPKYLIDNYALALAPRLNIPKPNTLQGKGLKILAAGLKEPDDNNKLKFPKLNYVEKEIKAIKEIANSNFSVYELIDNKFKIKNLKKEIDTSAFKVLHLATHGEFSSSPEKTFLLARDEPININQIGDIFRTQAQRQPEPIEILVLSACETAAGDKRATLGISGVSVRAGARSSIASLWTLDDEISVDFTKIFYKQLIKQKVTKAQALQEAQKQLKDLPGREHPRYWAPYILLGNWL
ncbi:CHAT domain-containing protein [Brasilonema bromeliae]|uniref:CHAT domain-containing protein n=1 Tax=Brasilonema bromeliae TaxID=383615 RepID=UPI0030D757AC